MDVHARPAALPELQEFLGAFQVRFQTHQHFKEHLCAFLMAYNFTKRLKTLRGLAPYEDICQCWHKERERFTVNPCQHTLGLNTEFAVRSAIRPPAAMNG
jgi:hypothetical protein